MKFSFGIIALAVAQLVSAYPGAGTGTLLKRMAPTDAANIGYATLGGGLAVVSFVDRNCSLKYIYRTTGGGSGPTVTVTTLAALKAAAASTTAQIIIISGTITGNEVVKVAANKTIYGTNKASKWHLIDLIQASFIYILS